MTYYRILISSPLADFTPGWRITIASSAYPRSLRLARLFLANLVRLVGTRDMHHMSKTSVRVVYTCNMCYGFLVHTIEPLQGIVGVSFFIYVVLYSPIYDITKYTCNETEVHRDHM